jgi:kynurenine formamidase
MGCKGDAPVDSVTYYGGFTQHDVKPTPDSPLLKLGIDKAPPIVTSAVLLDAKIYVGKGRTLEPGQLITAKDIEGMITAQRLGWRGLLPGDVLYIYTGWSENWQDPDKRQIYYKMGPGLSEDAARYLEQKRIVLVALDNPFTDPMSKDKLPYAGGEEHRPQGAPWFVHHYDLTHSGIHQIQNANLADLAKDKVWTSCTMIFPLREYGHAGSPVRPVAIGAPTPN